MSADQKQIHFVSFDPIQGRGHELIRIENDPEAPYIWDLSPDGRHLAIEKSGQSQGQIRILSLAGEPARDIAVKGWGGLSSLDWAADGKGFFAGSQSTKGATLLHIDLEGNAQALWVQNGGSHTWGAPSRDGKRLAILGRSTQSNVWMLESF